MDGASESIELNSPPDILRSDLDYHRYLPSRSGNPLMAGPMHYPQSKYFQGPRYLEGTGRLNGNIPRDSTGTYLPNPVRITAALVSYCSNMAVLKTIPFLFPPKVTQLGRI